MVHENVFYQENILEYERNADQEKNPKIEYLFPMSYKDHLT